MKQSEFICKLIRDAEAHLESAKNDRWAGTKAKAMRELMLARDAILEMEKEAKGA